jgi:hypothetical protein
VWTADHEGVQVVDVSDPAAPMVLASEATPSWAMGVHAVDSRVYLADWNAVSLFEIDTSVSAPHADPSSTELYFVSGATTTDLSLWNRGGADLEIVGVDASDSRLAVEVDRFTVAPGEAAQVQVSFQDDGQPLNQSLCIATNDPDQPLQTIHVATNSEGSSVLVGEPAPDFILPDLEGNYHRLSEELGHPVVLCYFATW